MALVFKSCLFFQILLLIYIVSTTGTSNVGFSNVCEAKLGFNIEEATIKHLQEAFASKGLTSRQLVDFYLHQIKTLNPVLRGVIEVNPAAREQAERSDRVRAEWNSSAPPLSDLLGIPVLLKDSINTDDEMNTTSGSYALLGAKAARDAGVVRRLRNAGAVILGKASMSEWYHLRDFSLPNGWCARSGQGLNPYVKEVNPCGSSSGPAISTAANMAAVSLGTETDGSILCPADSNSIVGFKPTVGLTSRAGVLPVSVRQDTIGPMCRTVSDAVYVLDAIVGFDARDFTATKAAAKFIPEGGYKQFLKLDGLKGKRLGVVRDPFLQLSNLSNAAAFLESHLHTLRKEGAVVLDDLEIPNVNAVVNRSQSGEITALLAEFKISLNDYLQDFAASPVRSLADIIAFNKNHRDLERYGDSDAQDVLIAAESTDGIGEKEKQAIISMEELSRDGFEKLMLENDLDAMVTIGSSACAVLAIGGYPGITVPAGYDKNGMPYGILFSGLHGTEPRLIEVSFAFEQATMARKPPINSAQVN